MLISSRKQITPFSGSSQSSGYPSGVHPNELDEFHSLNRATQADLQGLVNVLLSTSDMDLQVNILGIFEGSIVSKKVDIDAIVSCDPIYEMINNILIRGLPLKSTNTLNFLCALLYLEEPDAENQRLKPLTVYAKNMIRSSGCLTTMCNMFTNTMMYQCTWAALCRCLAEVCRNSEVNQSFCSYLIPMCIQKCSTVNVEILLVLKSLLHNNHVNAQTFLTNKGLSIINRDLLQYDTCMQLLYNIVQTSKQACSHIQKSNIMQYLIELVSLHGRQSQIGSWSFLILRCLNPEFEESQAENVEQRSVQTTRETTFVINKIDEENTVNLFQNVAREVYLWNTNHHFKRTGQTPSFYDLNDRRKRRTNYFSNTKSSNGVSANDKSKELSFSFLLSTASNLRMSTLLKNKESPKNRLKRHLIKDNCKTYLSERGSPPSKLESTLLHRFSNITKLNTRKEKSLTDTSDFHPAFASTPKLGRIKRRLKPRLRQNYSKVATRETQGDESQILVRDKKNQSTSSRFFNAINESCISVVQTITSIFKPRDNQSIMDSKKNKALNNDCSYSFTNYMKKFDAMKIATNNSTLESDKSSENQVKFCKTCNDTKVLEHKLANDRFLRQTIKKLKMGINLFGCDFKKISRTMWPREKYMNPVVLHNLYRKLLVK